MNRSTLDGNKTGDYSSVGLFFPLPDSLAQQFPKMPEDRSPAHVTFLIVGKVPKHRESDLLGIVRSHVRNYGPLTCSLLSKDLFESPSGQVIHHLPAAFDRDVGSFRKAIKSELIRCGFEVSDIFPDYRPHATLSYSDDDTPYTGPEPTGSFEPILEVWGMDKVHSFPFSTVKTADLSPALGLPTEAGPCYLAERIFHNVRNEKVRDELIREIEEGGRDFDGKDENLVYDALKERGPENSAMYLLPHVQRRMDERGVTVQDIRGSLKNWLRWLNREKSMQTPAATRVSEEFMYGRKIQWDDPKERLTVIFRGTQRKNEYVVITVYWSDFYNSSHKPTNCEMPTKKSSSEYTSAAVAFVRDDKVLLVRRGVTAPWMPGSWTLVAGGIEKGESPAQAARREAFEETRLKPLELKLLGVANSPGEGEIHFFMSRKFDGELALDWENDMYAWVGLDTLDTYSIPRLQRWFVYKTLDTFGLDKAMTIPGRISSLARDLSAHTDRQATNLGGRWTHIVVSPIKLPLTLQTRVREISEGAVFKVYMEFSAVPRPTSSRGGPPGSRPKKVPMVRVIWRPERAIDSEWGDFTITERRWNQWLRNMRPIR